MLWIKKVEIGKKTYYTLNKTINYDILNINSELATAFVYILMVSLLIALSCNYGGGFGTAKCFDVTKS